MDDSWPTKKDGTPVRAKKDGTPDMRGLNWLGKVRESQRGVPLSESRREAIGQALRGRSLTDAHKKAIGDGKRGKPVPCMQGENHPNFGRSLTMAQRLQISASLRGRPGHPHTEESKEKIRQAQLGEGNSMAGSTPWNKGEAMWSEREHPHKGKKMSDTACHNMSVAARARIEKHGLRREIPAGVDYEGERVLFHSKAERRYFLRRQAEGVPIRRYNVARDGRRTVLFQGRERAYVPDFVELHDTIPVVIEVKGYRNLEHCVRAENSWHKGQHIGDRTLAKHEQHPDVVIEFVP